MLRSRWLLLAATIAALAAVALAANGAVELDWGIALAGLGVGFVVGLTGMGGGALMTPLLVLGFGVAPLAAVSSDLVASLVMKPVGGAVHLRRGTVDRALVGWLCLGSVPAAFAGVVVLDLLGGASFEDGLEVLLGVALLVAVAAMLVRFALAGRRDDGDGPVPLRVRPLPTIAIGLVGGLMVGMTSVGSGSLVIVALMLLYPTLASRNLVGTDLVQAVPLVGAAALGHLLFGDLQLALTTALLVGAIPGVWLGAHTSSRAPDRVVRPTLVLVLSVSALKLLGVANLVVAVLVVAAASTAGVVALTRRARRRAVSPATPPPVLELDEAAV